MPHGCTAAGARANCSQVVLSSNKCYLLQLWAAVGSAQVHFSSQPHAKKNGLPHLAPSPLTNPSHSFILVT
jgi:hypothetical protein